VQAALKAVISLSGDDRRGAAPAKSTRNGPGRIATQAKPTPGNRRARGRRPGAPPRAPGLRQPAGRLLLGRDLSPHHRRRAPGGASLADLGLPGGSLPGREPRGGPARDAGGRAARAGPRAPEARPHRLRNGDGRVLDAAPVARRGARVRRAGCVDPRPGASHGTDLPGPRHGLARRDGAVHRAGVPGDARDAARVASPRAALRPRAGGGPRHVVLLHRRERGGGLRAALARRQPARRGASGPGSPGGGAADRVLPVDRLQPRPRLQRPGPPRRALRPQEAPASTCRSRSAFRRRAAGCLAPRPGPTTR
jgi:hypothetical protein